jgi:hypothetical protein
MPIRFWRIDSLGLLTVYSDLSYHTIRTCFWRTDSLGTPYSNLFLENWFPGSTYILFYLITLFQSASGEWIPWEFIYIVLSYYPFPIHFWRINSLGYTVHIYCPILSPFSNPLLENWLPGNTYIVTYLITLFQSVSGELIPWEYTVHIYCLVLSLFSNPLLEIWFPGSIKLL